MEALFNKSILLRSFIAALLAATLVSAASARENVGWRKYQNEQHGFSMDLPTALFSEAVPAEEGDGITFTNPARGLFLSVYGFADTEALSLRGVRDLVKANYTDRKITYERTNTKRGWIALSGYEPSNNGAGRSIFYNRLASNTAGTRFAVFELVYPESERGTVDALITRMSRSLTRPAR